MGYGPLVRATTGVTKLWTSDDDPGFYDATTIFPDHVVARITAIAALASLIGSERTGTGAHVHISQAEAAVNQLAASYVTDAARTATAVRRRRSRRARGVPVRGGRRVVRDLAADRIAIVWRWPPRWTHRICPKTAVISWTRCRHGRRGLDKDAVADVLQRAGVPAAPMNRAVDVLADPVAVAPEVVHRHGASAVRPPDAHRDRPCAVRTHPAGGIAARADARRTHPRDLPEAALPSTPRRSTA